MVCDGYKLKVHQESEIAFRNLSMKYSEVDKALGFSRNPQQDLLFQKILFVFSRL